MLQILRSIRTVPLVIVAALVGVSLATGVFYSVIIPPWQAPDEPRHLEYAVRLSEKGWILQPEDLSIDLQRRILQSMRDSDFWRLTGRDQPDPLPASFVEDPLLRRSGTSFGERTPLYAIGPALVFRLLPGDDLVLRLYVMRWFSVGLSAATVAVACLVAFRLFPHDRFMIIAVPAFVVFLPMFAFIGASASSDALAILLVSLLIWELARIMEDGLSWRSAMAVGSLALLSLMAKKTAFFAMPLVLVAIPLSFWGRGVPLRQKHKGTLGMLAVLSVLLATVLLSWRGDEAAGWVQLPHNTGDSRSDTEPRSGDHSLAISSGRLIQSLPFNTVRALRGKSVTLEIWVRSPKGDQRGSLLVEDDHVRSVKSFLGRQTWRRHTITHPVSPDARSMRVILSAGSTWDEAAGRIYFDDVVLTHDQMIEPSLLRNGSAEKAALRVRPRLSGLTRYVSATQLLDLRSYDLASLQRYCLYLLLTFAGFWANFGWLTLPLHLVWYAVLAVLTLASAVGLAFWGADFLRQRRKSDSWVPKSHDRTLLLFVIGLVLILIQTFLPMVGSQWQPQGRYLFPALIIIATLFAHGLRRLIHRARLSVLTVTYLACFLLFDALCIAGYILPQYHS